MRQSRVVLLVFLGGCFSARSRISPQQLTVDVELDELVNFYTGVDCAFVAGWSAGRLGMQSSCEPMFSKFSPDVGRPEAIMMDQSLGVFALYQSDPSSVRLAYMDFSGEVSDDIWSFGEDVQGLRLIRTSIGSAIEWQSFDNRLCRTSVMHVQEGVILDAPHECMEVDRLDTRGALRTNFVENSAVVESGLVPRSQIRMSITGVGAECGLALFGPEVHVGCPSSENDGMWDWAAYRGDSEVVFEASMDGSQWHEAGDTGFAVMKGKQFSGHPAAGCRTTTIPRRWSLLDVDYARGTCPIGLFESPNNQLYLVDTRRSVDDRKELRNWRTQCWEDGQCSDPPFRR